jgi:hypothetical protein
MKRGPDHGKRVVPATLPPRACPGDDMSRGAPDVCRARYRLLRTRWGASRKRPPLTSLVTTPS